MDNNPIFYDLFFINLGGYNENEVEEYHYKTLTTAKNSGLASKKAKTTTFYKHFGFKGATPLIDDKYGIDVDDIYNVGDILAENYKQHFSLKITKNETILEENPLHIGYLKLDKIAI